MTHLTPEQNDRLRAAMEAAIEDRFRTRFALAEAMGVRPPVISDLLNLKSGASMVTAEAFAQRVAKKPVEDIIGTRKLSSVTRMAPRKPEGGGFPLDAETRRRAAVLLRQPPQNFSAEAIEIGLDSIVLRTAEEAKNPAFAAELARIAILGTVAHLRQPSPSDPPAGTRRSRKLGR